MVVRVFMILYYLFPVYLDRLSTPTAVWNSECRHMLGVVLRELEGATPGLQDVPAIEVHEVCSRACDLNHRVLASSGFGVPSCLPSMCWLF